jgi:3-hydroxyisobutyrate dehydrogenase/2-hydroxy-3-oxopropionate reductase
MGDVGAGQAAKLCNQLIVAANVIAIAEAFALADALGLDARLLPGALAGGFADSTPLQVFGPRMALATDPGPPVSALRTMYKDAAEVRRAAAEACKTPLPLLEAVDAVYRTADEAGHGLEDLPSLMRLYRE